MFSETEPLVSITSDSASMPGFYDYFSGIEDLWFLVWLIVLFVWIVIILRVVKDITARTTNFWWHFFSVFVIIVLTPVIGLPLYLALRPLGMKYDKMPWREAILSSMCSCSNCATLNKIEHICCTGCGELLQITCRECSQYHSHTYGYCPNCGAPNIES